MKYRLDIKDKLSNHIEIATQLLLLLLVVFDFISADKHSSIKSIVLFVGLLCWFFFSKKTRHPIIWIILFALLILDFYHFYFRLANHQFMLTFVVLSVILYLYHKQTDILIKNIQVLLVVVILASSMQKLMSSQFMSGDFYYYMLNRGFVFDVLHPFFPETLEVAKSNSESILALHNTDPNLAQYIVLKDIFPNLAAFSLIFAWITVVLEFIVAIAILWKPKNTWTHLLFAVMIIGILITRRETGFMALLAICGIFLCSNLKLRLVYVVIVLGCIALIITKIGFH